MASSSATTSTSTTSSHPPRPFVRPLFLGKPTNPPLPRPAAADRVVTVANPAGYIRNTNPTAVMTFSSTTPQPRPFAPPATAADPPGAHLMCPPGPHHFVVPRQPVGGPHKTAPVAATSAPKAAPFPAVSLAPENINFNDSGRERSREDTLVMIHGRKVRMSEGGSGSLYALCRSWVRNGLPQENQPNIGDSLRILPKPLPASAISSQLRKEIEETNEAEDSGKEDITSGEDLSADDLLKGHIKHAKKVRSRLRKERLLKIERYKQRLSLLLPTQMELIGRNDATPQR
ncbi:uncharacterized protein M6B38_415840 [Iris pallida]|uniref:Uncharacterized protein n=1 Tax=Iris pallida TaxID=29817 RepID=A0AAX6FKB4_IRIPA|nr:uncharacterized protein M6B38_415840 [Iris pallida]